MGWYEDDYVRFEEHLCDFCLQEVATKIDVQMRAKHPEWFHARALKNKRWLGHCHVKEKHLKEWYEYRKKAFDKARRMCVVISIEGSYNCYCHKHLRELGKLLKEKMRLHECSLKQSSCSTTCSP